MKSSRLFLRSLFAALSLGVSIPSGQAFEQGLRDYFPDPDGIGPGNQRYDYTYWAPTPGSTAWDANNWCWNYYGEFLGDPLYRGIRWYEVTNPTTSLNNAMYAVFWDALSSGAPETFKTVDLNSNILVRGLHFRNEGWNIQDADHANTLTLISGSSFPSGSVSYDDRQAITMDTGSRATISANIVLGAFVGSSETSNGINQYIAMGAQSALTISGNISETGAPKILTVGSTLYPPGSGSALTLSGNNTFTGGVTVWGDFTTTPYGRTTTARLNINSAQALGTGPLTVQRGPVILSNTSGAAVTIANSLVLSSTTPGATGNFYNRTAVVADTDNLVFDSAHDLTINGNLTLNAHRAIRVEDGAGDLILGGRILSDGSTTSSFFKNGPGTLVLSGTDSTYTGVTQINGGVLEVTHLANAGQASSIGASANTVAKNLAGIYGVHVSTSSTTYNAAANAPLPGLILSNGGTLRYIGTGDSTDRLIGLLPGRRDPADLVTTPVSIDASGSGALKFTNAGDVIHVHNMNLFRVLNLTGTNTDDNTFNLALTDITGNTSPYPVVRNQLTKSGTGKWILSGTNTHTGGTTVYDGTLQLGNSGTVLADTGAVIVNGGTFRLGAANETIGSLSGTGGTVDLFNGSGRTLTLADSDDGTYAGAIVGAGGALAKTGTGTLTLNGSNTYTGGTTISDGTLKIGNGGTTGSLLGNVSVGTNATLSFNRSNALNFDGTISGPGRITQVGTGTTTLTAANTYTGTTTIGAGTLQFAKQTSLYNNATASWTATNLVVASGATAAFNVGGTGEFTASDIDTLKSLGTATGGFANGAFLGFDTTNAANGVFVYNGNLTNTNGGANALGLVKLGTGTLELGGANTYSGATNVNAGTLRLGSATALSANTTLNVATGATFDTNGYAQAFATLTGTGTINVSSAGISVAPTTTNTYAGSLTGTGGLTMNGTGTLVLNNATNNFSGPVTISSGTLQVGATGALSSGLNVSLANSATLALANHSTTVGALTGNGAVTLGSATLTLSPTSGTNTFAGAISGTGGVTVTGGGTVVLSGTSNYSGATSVSSATLVVNGSSAVSDFSIGSGGILGGSGTVGDLMLSAGSTLAPGNSPGTLTVTGNTTWNGGANYLWEINNAANPQSPGSAGTHYDLLSISGSLTINATAGNKFTITLASLLANNTAGDVVNFNSAVNSSYTIASATGGIIGFDANAFTINATGFTNNLNGGSWNLSQVGNNLNLNFAAAASAIPEPSTYAAIFGALVLGVALHRKRQRRA